MKDLCEALCLPLLFYHLMDCTSHFSWESSARFNVYLTYQFAKFLAHSLKLFEPVQVSIKPTRLTEGEDRREFRTGRLPAQAPAFPGYAKISAKQNTDTTDI